VFKTVIPRSVRLSEAPSFGLPVAMYRGESRGALAYAELAAELRARDSHLAADGLTSPGARDVPEPLVSRPPDSGARSAVAIGGSL
jgi:hypothetical protein